MLVKAERKGEINKNIFAGLQSRHRQFSVRR